MVELKQDHLGQWILYSLGRRDRQIKRSGKRIDLETIENAVLRCAGVSEAGCVQIPVHPMTSQDPVETGLTAIVVVAIATVKIGDLFDPIALEQRIRSALHAELPPLLRPNAIVVVQQSDASGSQNQLNVLESSPLPFLPHGRLPRTITGKIDRIELQRLCSAMRAKDAPAIAVPASNRTDVSAHAALRDPEQPELVLADEIRQVFVRVMPWVSWRSHDVISIDSDFHHLGGDSLLAAYIVSVLASLHSELDTDKLTVAAVLQHSTPRLLANWLRLHAGAQPPVQRPDIIAQAQLELTTSAMEVDKIAVDHTAAQLGSSSLDATCLLSAACVSRWARDSHLESMAWARHQVCVWATGSQPLLLDNTTADLPQSDAGQSAKDDTKSPHGSAPAWSVSMEKCVDASPLLFMTRSEEILSAWSTSVQGRANTHELCGNGCTCCRSPSCLAQSDAAFQQHVHSAAPSRGGRCVVLIGSHSGLFVCVDAATGATVWNNRLPDRIEATASMSQDRRRYSVVLF